LTFKETTVINNMSIFNHCYEVKSCKEELTEFIDRTLDNYTAERNPLLKKLVELREEIEELEKQYDNYITNN